MRQTRRACCTGRRRLQGEKGIADGDGGLWHQRRLAAMWLTHLLLGKAAASSMPIIVEHSENWEMTVHGPCSHHLTRRQHQHTWKDAQKSATDERVLQDGRWTVST